MQTHNYKATVSSERHNAPLPFIFYHNVIFMLKVTDTRFYEFRACLLD